MSIFGRFGNFSGGGPGPKWKNLTDISQLDHLEDVSKETPVAIYKHSNRCGVCLIAKENLESGLGDDEPMETYFVNVVSERTVSNAIAQRFGLRHESPQIMLIKDGKVVYHRSHFGIDPNELRSQAESAQ